MCFINFITCGCVKYSYDKELLDKTLYYTLFVEGTWQNYILNMGQWEAVKPPKH